jgi:hypothetical protein
MGFFDLFKKKIVIEDAFFGTLKFQRIKSSNSEGFFLGKKDFTPLNKQVDIIFNGDGIKVKEEQKEFYQILEKNYNELLIPIKNSIEDVFKNMDEDFSIKDFNNEFSLTNIKLPSFLGNTLVWELSYNSIHDENHIFSINFQNWDIEDVVIDG